MTKLKNKYFGPSTIIAAAFIGPGTLTTCSLAGVKYGYELMWALLFSTLATMLLQEMAARVGFFTKKGLSEAIKVQFTNPIARILIYALIVSAIFIGNAAYEAGNISGAIIGLDLVFGESNYWVFLIFIVAFILLVLGKYKWLEKLLIGLVILMSISFFVTVIIIQPNLTDIFKGFIPNFSHVPDTKLILGLIGTTVVPYNLFLHASIISKGHKNSDWAAVKVENRFSILFGGLISMLIIITAAGASSEINDIRNAHELAIQLEPFFGRHSTLFMGVGYLAAGLSSTLTAAMAAAYVLKGIMEFKESHWLFSSSAVLILLVGTAVTFLDINIIVLIKFAQVANAIVLPIIAIILLILSQNKALLKSYVNTPIQNILACLVILVCLGLSLKTFIFF